MPQELSIYMVQNKRLNIPMLVHNFTRFLSAMCTFIRKNDSDHALFIVMDVIKGIKMNEQTLFERKSRFNSRYSLL